MAPDARHPPSIFSSGTSIFHNVCLSHGEPGAQRFARGAPRPRAPARYLSAPGHVAVPCSVHSLLRQRAGGVGRPPAPAGDGRGRPLPGPRPPASRPLLSPNGQRAPGRPACWQGDRATGTGLPAPSPLSGRAHVINDMCRSVRRGGRAGDVRLRWKGNRRLARRARPHQDLRRTLR